MTQEAKGNEAGAGQALDTTQADSVAGGLGVSVDLGSCSVTDLTSQLTQAYENLVDTASYVIERVITAAKQS